MSETVALYHRERVRAQRRSTLRLRWEQRRARRRRPLDDRATARLGAVKRELAVRGALRTPAPWGAA